MRLGAAIIVVIGVFIASIILFDRSTRPELQRIEAAEIKNGFTPELEECRASLTTMRAYFWTLHLATIFVLACMLRQG